jgi:hypothetical protein
MTQQLEQLDASSDEAQTNEVLESLKETHATSAGLKAFSTWWALETIDKCRQACGGHGCACAISPRGWCSEWLQTRPTPAPPPCTPTRPSRAPGRATSACTCLTAR